MTPPCCKKCNNQRDHSTCATFKKCLRWRAWFSRVWADIREAAKQYKQEGDPKE